MSRRVSDEICQQLFLGIEACNPRVIADAVQVSSSVVLSCKHVLNNLLISYLELVQSDVALHLTLLPSVLV